MTIKEYTEQIAKEFSKRIDKPVVTTERKKNNGVIFYGLQVIETDTINSIFYINNLYQGELEVDEALDNLCMWFEELKGERLRSYQWLKNFDLVKGNLSYKLVNKEQNKFLMQDYVCEEFLDLLKVYIININELPDNIQRGSIMIEKRLLELWNVTEQEVKETAEQNIINILPCMITGMNDYMRKVANSKGLEIREEAEELLNGCKMWVLSNQYMNDGATGMCFKHELKKFADLHSDDIYIVPSSIHELILIPSKEVDADYLKEMVIETNRSQVMEEEFLSNNVYLFKRVTSEIEIVSGEWSE